MCTQSTEGKERAANIVLHQMPAGPGVGGGPEKKTNPSLGCKRVLGLGTDTFPLLPRGCPSLPGEGAKRVAQLWTAKPPATGGLG